MTPESGKETAQRYAARTHMDKYLAALAVLLAAPLAHADDVTARVEGAKLKYGTCATAPCAVNQEQTIPLTDIDAANVKVTNVGRLVWVHVPSHGAASWDAVLAGRQNALVHSEQTGKIHGQPGSMSGTKIEVINGYVARGSVSEDFTI